MTSTHILRRFEPSLAEYEAIVRVYNQANPDEPGSAETWRHWDQHRDPDRMFKRYVAEHQGEIIGYGFTVRTDPAANKFRFACYFPPQLETAQGIHSFYSYLAGLCLELNATALLCQTRENEAEKIAWLRGNGFAEVMRYPRSILTLVAFDPAPYSDLRAGIAAQGLEIVSLVEFVTREPGWQRKIYDLENVLMRDVPMPATYTPPPFEQYAQREFDTPDFLPELWLVALDGDTPVGMTSLFNLGGSLDMLENGLTGVLRPYRRRGLATALKCQVIETAQRLGARSIITFNEENNPMFQLNLKLGFVIQPADVEWEKVIDSQPQADTEKPAPVIGVTT